MSVSRRRTLWMRKVLALSAVAVVTAAGAGAAPAHKQPSAQKAALAAIARQLAGGHIAPADARRDRAALARAVRLVARLPAVRSEPLAAQLEQIDEIAPKLTAPRALAIFGQLEVNEEWFARHRPPAPQTDITDADGIVYRYFSGRGFEIHPLADFGALNAAAASKDVALTTKLGMALAERGVPEPSGGTGWEYYFDYAGGHAPWLSGFAQAVAAQAFARAATVDTADSATLTAEARAAFRTIPGHLVRQTGFGQWIKLYSFNHAVVLNAQLQSAISLADFGKSTSDARASALAAEMKEAAARALPSFSTGYWSFYELPDEPSPQSYQTYVIQLLQSLSKSDPRFATAATKFGSFETEPPAFKLADSGPGSVHFWVSKPSTLHISALGRGRRLAVSGGWHTISWALPSRAGVFPVTIHATDWAGNAASVDALPLVRVATTVRHKRHAPPVRKTTGVGLETSSPSLPPLSVGAGLENPLQGSLAAEQGFHTARMTLVWPGGSNTPDPGAIAALNRLPMGTELTLELYLPALPTDDAGRAALAAYAASLGQQVPSLQDLVVGPAPAAASASTYVSTLAAVYDAVKSTAPLVRVDGALDGAQAPKTTLAALAAAYRASGRATPLMDELAFAPAPAAGKGLWALGSLSTLIAALDAGFGGTAQPGASLPLIVDQIAVQSEIPTAETSLYESATVGTTGVSESSQASAYLAALKAVSCKPTVVELLFQQLVDGRAAGEQSGLFYADGTGKTSMQAVANAVTVAQGDTRGCAAASTSPTPAPPSPTPVPAPPSPTPVPAPAAPAVTTTTTTGPSKPAHVLAADESKLRFPSHVSLATAPDVRVGCVTACLYLVAMERAGDGTPVLARRGAIPRAGAATVRLPKAPIAPGSYRFAVWIVAATDPGPVTIERSAEVEAG